MFRRRKAHNCPPDSCDRNINYPGVHSHSFAGITSQDVNHRHKYNSVTDPAMDGVPHVHTYSTITTLDDGHVHEMSGVTGPAIPLADGGHYHCYRGVTSFSGLVLHTHCYSGPTNKD